MHCISGSILFLESGSDSARIRVKSCILMGIHIKVKIQKLLRLKMEPRGPWMLTMEV
jgi:hypothetical protein